MRTNAPVSLKSPVAYLALVLALGTGPLAAQEAPPATTPAGNTTTETTTTTTTTPATPATTPAPAASGSEAEQQAILLNPFVVSSSEDQGYHATSTLAGTRVRTDLSDIASAITVVTGKELQDLAATDNEDLLTYTPSTEVAGIKGNFTGVAGNTVFVENTINPTTRVRGLDSADNTRDYFLTDIPWDSFDVDRVDLQRGPNSILFGVGSPAGIINVSPTDASFQQHFNIEDRIDEWGTTRESLNFNIVLIPDVLAIRLAGLVENQYFQQQPAFNDQKRYYAAVRFDPKLFDEHSHTEIRAKYEWGQVRSNNPRQDPPADEITPWFQTGTDAYGNPGFNKLIINQWSTTNANPSGTPLPGMSGSLLGNVTYQLSGNAETRSYWADILNYYEGTPINVNGLNTASNLPIKTITAEANESFSLNSNQQIGGVYGFRPYGIPDYSSYAAYVSQPGTNTNTIYPNGVTPVTFTYPGNPIPGGVYYKDKVLTDPSIFNFYKLLLDGPNKHEWQDWGAFNVALDQSFFDNRLAFEVAFDHQKYDQGTDGWLSGQNYAISIDVNATYADGTANPNAGRPYVGNAASAPSLNYGNTTERNTIRFTPTAEFRPADFISNSWLAQAIGIQNFTGLAERNEITTFSDSWAEYATTQQYLTDNFPSADIPPNALASNREFDWLVYLGPNMQNDASAANAHLTNINFVVQPPVQQTVENFNSHWIATGTPGYGNTAYVNPAAPFTYTNYTNGQTNTGTQADNPANYGGWQGENVTWMYASDPTEFPSLVETANRIQYRDISDGFIWQGHMFGGDLVPTVGWRRDKITNYQTQPATDPVSDFTPLNFPTDPTSRTDVSGDSKSWGVVYHVPHSIMDKLPWDMGLSVFLDSSQNFKADASRLSLGGTPIPNATGRTREGGFEISALNDRISLKASYFRTLVDNATLDDTVQNDIGGLGENGYFLADGVLWGYNWATAEQEGIEGQTPNSTYWDYVGGDFGTAPDAATRAEWNNIDINGGTYGGKTYVGGTAIVNAWLNLPLPASYFASFNLTPSINPVIGEKTGQLSNSYSVAPNESTGPATGGGSNFGNHDTTVNNLSEGVEIELYANPIKGWDFTANFAHTQATHESVDPLAQNFIGLMTKFMNGPGGQVRMWYNGGPTLGSDWDSSIVAPFTVLLNDQGHQVPELSPWRFNLINSYTFSGNTFLRGAFIGLGLRIDGPRIIGFHFDPNFTNVNSSDPDYAGVASLTQGGLNVNEPFYGAIESHVDMWFGYNWKLWHNINWRIQLNLSNVGEKDHLIPSAVEPDGSLALARISYGTSWQLTNSFDF